MVSLPPIDALDRVARKHTSPPDVREIYEWASREVELPNSYAVTGKFDASRVPFVKEPFHALRNPLVRTVVAMSGVQCLKTLVGELWLLHTVCENPGPSQWLQTTDDEAKEHCLERFNQLVKHCLAVHRFFTENRHDKRTAAIIFAHMFLVMEGAQNLRNLQRKSIKNQMCSEVWQWPPGRLDEAEARLTQFTFNSKRYIESQAGIVDDDLHRAFLKGDQSVWNLSCLSCGHVQPWKWQVMRLDGTKGGIKWEDSGKTRRENGEWRWGELASTVRYECVKCGFGMTDEPRNRVLLNQNGRYVAQNPEAPAHRRSFSWNQLTVDRLSWFSQVEKYLRAQDQLALGNEIPMREFHQKVLAEPYDADKLTDSRVIHKIELNSTDPAKHWEKQDFIFLTVDVQRDHFWFMVQAWSRGGEDMILEVGKLHSWVDIQEKQKKFGVTARLVFIDCGYNFQEVIQNCALNGWTAFRGEPRRTFTYTIKAGPERGRKLQLPHSWPVQHADPCKGLNHSDPNLARLRGKYAKLFYWSNPTIKDIAKNRRDKMMDGKLSFVASTVDDKELMTQLFSERVVKEQNKQGYEIERWEKIGRRANHLWDCYCMGVAAACLGKVLGDTPFPLHPGE